MIDFSYNKIGKPNKKENKREEQRPGGRLEDEE